MTKNPTREDVQAAVDKLVQRQRIRSDEGFRLVAEDKQVEWQTIPSLWEQLCTSTSWQGGGAGAGAFGSRPVIATGVVSLRNEITFIALKGADEVHAKRENSPAGKLELADIAANRAFAAIEDRKAELDMIVAHPTKGMSDEEKADYAAELMDAIGEVEAATQHWAGLSDQAEAKRYALIPDSLRAIAASLNDLVDVAWWRELILGWATQIRSNLALDPVRAQFARNTACPLCGETTSTSTRDGETVRTPALAITWGGPDDDQHHADDEWKVRAVECRACGAVWPRGADMDRLVDQMMIAAVTQQPLADTA